MQVAQISPKLNVGAQTTTDNLAYPISLEPENQVPVFSLMSLTFFRRCHTCASSGSPNFALVVAGHLNSEDWRPEPSTLNPTRTHGRFHGSACLAFQGFQLSGLGIQDLGLGSDRLRFRALRLLRGFGLQRESCRAAVSPVSVVLLCKTVIVWGLGFSDLAGRAQFNPVEKGLAWP